MSEKKPPKSALEQAAKAKQQKERVVIKGIKAKKDYLKSL